MMSSEDDGAGDEYNSGSVYGNSHRRQQHPHEMDTNVQPIYHYPNGGAHTRISQTNGSHINSGSNMNGRTGSVSNSMIQQNSSTTDHLRIRGSSSAAAAHQNGNSLPSPTAGPTTSTATHSKKRSSLGAWSTGSDDDHPFLYAVNTQPRMFLNDAWNDDIVDGTSGGRPRYSKRIWMVAFSLLVLTSAMLMNAFTTFRSARRIQYNNSDQQLQQQQQKQQGQYYQQQQQPQEQQQPQIVADDIQLQQQQLEQHQQPEPGQQPQEYLEWMSTEGLQSPKFNEQEQQHEYPPPPEQQQQHQPQEHQQQTQEESSIQHQHQPPMTEEEQHIQHLLEPSGFPKDYTPIFQNVRTLQEVLGGNHVSTLEETGDIIFFWHIPKAAGSTLKDMLDFCYDKVRAEKVRDPPSLDIVQVTERHKLVNVDTNYTDAIRLAKQMHLLDSDLSEESPVPVQVQTIVSSYLWDASTLFTPHHKGRMITILRHPIERDISMFHYLQKATWEPTYDSTLKHLSLMDYATNHKHGDNWMVRYLTHDKRGKITKDHVEYATQLLQTYCLIGFVHHSDKAIFEKSIKRIETYLQIQPIDAQCVEQYTQGIGVNVNSRRDHHERQIEKDQHPMEGTPEWNALAELHQFDLILWNNAQQIYQEQGQQLLGGLE